MINGELIVDNFAGGGGASTGIELATGYSVDIAINHDPEAIRMHKANHPNTKHYCENVWAVDPETICQCTGIKDKNGKLIFENDILEGHLDDKYPEDVTRTKVIWDKNGWVTSEQGAVDREPLDDFDTEYFEVVGNAIDNLDLVEGSHDGE